jgi:hypothetical protein
VASNAPKIQRNSIPFSQPNGSPLNANLGFVAHSVIIDNRTSSYLYIPPANRWVDPGLGAAFAFPGVAGGLLIDWTAPPGKTQVAAIPTEQAQVTYFSDPVPPGFGITSTQPVASGVAGPQEIDRQIPTASVSTITIPQSGVLSNLGSFNSLEIRIITRSDRAAALTDTLLINVNGDSTAVYNTNWVKGTGGAASNSNVGNGTAGQVGDYWPAAATAAGFLGIGIIYIHEFATSFQHSMEFLGGATTNVSTQITEEGTIFYKVASVITTLALSWNSGANFLGGSTYITTTGYQ